MQVWVRTCLQAFLSYSLSCNIAQNTTANASQAYSFNLLAKLYVTYFPENIVRYQFL